MAGHLRVNPAAVARGGEGLANAAATVPGAPPALPAVPAGDPLSAAVWAHQQTAELLALEGLAQVQAHSAATAAKTSQAARMYEDADADLGSRLNSAQFGAAQFGDGAVPAAATAASTGGSASPASGPGSMLGTMGQLASQAGQGPAQLGGPLASAPQSLVGAATSAVGQVSDLTGTTGATGGATPGVSGGDGERAPVDGGVTQTDRREKAEG